MSTRSAAVLAETWNHNESGRLWTREWRRGAEGFSAQLFCSGCFLGPVPFDDEEEFWTAYRAEADKFAGRRLRPA